MPRYARRLNLPNDRQHISGELIGLRTLRGRKFRPLARIPYDRREAVFEGDFHRCRFDGASVTIEAKGALAAAEADWTKAWRRVGDSGAAPLTRAASESR